MVKGSHGRPRDDAVNVQRPTGRTTLTPTSAPCREDQRPGREVGRHVESGFPVGQQPLCDRTANAVGALDRPDPLWPPMGHLQQLPIVPGVRPEPARRTQHIPNISCLDRDRRLVRVHPDDYLIHNSLSSHRRSISEDGHRNFELSSSRDTRGRRPASNRQRCASKIQVDLPSERPGWVADDGSRRADFRDDRGGRAWRPQGTPSTRACRRAKSWP